MTRASCHTLLIRLLLAGLFCIPAGLMAQAPADQELREQARRLHDETLILDSHVDIPPVFATSEHLPGDADAQVNLDRMRSGGLDAAFFIVYVGQGPRTESGYLAARADALAKFDAIHRMTQLYPDRIGLATTADEAEALHEEGRLVAMIGVENGYSIGRNLSLLETFRSRGARYMTLIHNGHNDIGDSAQPIAELGDDETEHGGLSEFGRRVVGELNRLGILVDVSHLSRQTMLDATRHSQAPVIASHSSVTALADHPRNMNDEQLMALRDNGGVIQIVAFDTYVVEGGGSTLSDFVDHIDYAVDLIGVEHVGISSDFGGGGGVDGWSHAGETFDVTLELVRRGYTEEEIRQLWGGNLLRVLREAGRVAE